MTAAITAAVSNKTNLFLENMKDATNPVTEFRLRRLVENNQIFESTDFIMDILKGPNDPTSLVFIQEEEDKKKKQSIDLFIFIQKTWEDRAVVARKTLEATHAANEKPAPICHASNVKHEAFRPVQHKVAPPEKAKEASSLTASFSHAASGISKVMHDGYDGAKDALGRVSKFAKDGIDAGVDMAQAAVRNTASFGADVAKNSIAAFNAVAHPIETAESVGKKITASPAFKSLSNAGNWALSLNPF